MNTNRLIQTTLIASALLGTGILRAEDAPKLETTKDKVSYAIGMNVGRNLKAQGFEVDPAIISQALNTALNGGTPALSEEDARAAIMGYQQELRAKQQEKAQEASAKNLKKKKKLGVF